jgi:hypothetical protein
MRQMTAGLTTCVLLAAFAAGAMAQDRGGARAGRALQADDWVVEEPAAQVRQPGRMGGATLEVAGGRAQRTEVEEVNELVIKWKATSESEREAVQKELRETVKRQFQVRLEAQEKEVEQLEAQVKQLREKLDLRRKKEGEIVNFRVEQLLREAQGLGWGTESVRPPLR